MTLKIVLAVIAFWGGFILTRFCILADGPWSGIASGVGYLAALIVISGGKK